MIAARTAGRTARLWVPLTLGAATLVLVYGRFVVQARGAVYAARAASAKGEDAEATRFYLDALRAYVPGSPFERQALDGLGDLAAAAVRARDRAGERRAIEAVRSGLLGTRSFFIPYRSRLADANLRLAQLDATEAFPPMDPKRIVVDRPRPRGPAIAATLIAFVGFASWVGGILLFIRSGVDRTPVSTRILPPVLFVLGFSLFLIGLRFT